MTVRMALAEGTERLAAAGIESARLDARVLLAEVLGTTPGEILTRSGELGAGERVAYQARLDRRAAREPLAYIIGRKEFWSLDIEVGRGALVPRPETETLIEQALNSFTDRASPLRILDLGTGTGCLLIAGLTLYPQAIGLGVDISEEALFWARRNVSRHGLEARAALLQGGWTAAEGRKFDLIFANPPYLADAEMAELAPELGHEPPGALCAGPQGLEAYQALGPAIAALLAPGGRAFLEIGAGQGAAATAALERERVEIVDIVRDLSGIPRCLVVRACATEGEPQLQKTVGMRETRG